MSFLEDFQRHVCACFSLWIKTCEPEETERQLAVICDKNNWKLRTWDCERGLRAVGQTSQGNCLSDPLSAVKAAADNSRPDDQEYSITLLHHLHLFLQNPVLKQAISNAIASGKVSHNLLVALSPTTQIPLELERNFALLEYPLPTSQELQTLASETAGPETLPQNSERCQALARAASGLTRSEAEGAVSLALTYSGTEPSPEAVWEFKTRALKKANLLRLFKGEKGFESLGGLEALKDFTKRSLRAGATHRPKGVLLLGPPGTGKSQFAKCLGKETGRPTLILDVGALKGSLQGQTEQNIRNALAAADAMAPCLLFVDEVEKALSGLESSSKTDGGVMAGVFGTLLTWLNDHQSDVYFLATCNRVASLPPEFSRAGRFDGTFFIDLPSKNERKAIWEQYQQAYFDTIFEEHIWPNDENWTGAEIEQCCRLSDLLGVPLAEAAEMIVPINSTRGDDIEELRRWADSKCLSASQPGLYHKDRGLFSQQGANGRRRTTELRS